MRARLVPIGVVLASAVLGALLGAGIAMATFSQDSDSDTHSSCFYSGYSSYNTDGPQYHYAQTFHDSCATYFALSVYECTPSCSPVHLSDWIDGSSDTIEPYENTTHAVTNVYGYHQIRKPAGSFSDTLETHP